MIDTGATISCVDRGVAVKIGLPLIHTRKISSATDPDASVPVYSGKVNVAQFGTETLELLGVDIQGEGLMMLIGRDVLKSSVLIYNGVAASFSLAR